MSGASKVSGYVVPPPDEEEEMLAKLVFGDTSDFQSNLADFDVEFALDEERKLDEEDELAGSEGESDDEKENNNAMDHITDDQLFFVDEGNEDDGAMEIDEEEGSDEGDSDSIEEDDNAAWVDSDDERISVPITINNKLKKLRKSYQDSHIEGPEYIRRLRSQFEKIYPRPQWADSISDSEKENSDSEEDDDSEDTKNVINGDINALAKILESTFSYKETSGTKLLPEKNLDILRLKDANASHLSHSAVQSLSFHPYKPLLLTGGYDRTLRVYHVDGKSNPMVTSVYLKGTPVQTCTFYVSREGANNKQPEDQRVFTGGRRRYMHSWDLAASFTKNRSEKASTFAKIDKYSRMYGHEKNQRSFEKFKVGYLHDLKANTTRGVIMLQGGRGWINIIDAATGVWITGCKIEGNLVDFCVDYRPLSRDRFETHLIVVNTYGQVWEFNLTKNNEIIRRWKDEGGMGITTIQVGGGTNSDQLLPMNSKRIRQNRWIAIGSESGFVNVYDLNSIRAISSETSESIARPAVTLDQLTTSISSLKFSPDGQILCMASRAIKDALRLVHLPSGTIFSNWPTSGTPLGKVTSVAFSSRGEMLAVGNEQGKVRLWRLNHFQ
ncbi:U3 small nucleolar RNA-associated protein 18 [Nakaseomyces bracarensis]|uniref:U3 small nucleolar RNA-associated protein 18 n=1 Tax=Nakaseomyces bracarensis TaxID=273131 RepID=A0ABR4NVE9_9SACH